MKKLLSMSQLFRKKYRAMPFEGVWRDAFGEPEFGSRWLVYGGSGQGKTDFCVKLARYVASFGRVLYVSAEEGDGKTIRQAMERNELLHANVQLAVEYGYEDLIKKVKSSRQIKTVIIDSVDYFHMTLAQYRELTDHRGTVICTAWAEGSRPAKKLTRAIEYMSDVKVRVDRYVAKARSRYGGYTDFVIWPEKAARCHADMARVYAPSEP